MNKISDLLNFLIKNAFYEEAEFLFKFANKQITEAEMETRFPKIWKAYNKSKGSDGKANPRLASWTQLIGKMKKIGMSDKEIDNLEIKSFEDLKNKTYQRIEANMKTRYPNIWVVYNESKGSDGKANPGFNSWDQLIGKMKKIKMSDEEIDNLEIKSFEDLKNKTDLKTSEAKMKAKFPNIWAVYNESNGSDGNPEPPLASWTQLIDEMKKIGMSDKEIDNLQINSFEDLKNKFEEIYGGIKDDMQTKYPNIWAVYNESKGSDGNHEPPLAFWTQLIDRMKKIGISDKDIDDLQINSFEDLENKTDLRIKNEVETRFPDIWDAYNKSKSPRFFFWADLIGDLINIPMTDQQIGGLNINNFNDLREAFKKNRIDPKNVFLNNLKKEDKAIHAKVMALPELLQKITDVGLIEEKVDSFIKIYDWSQGKAKIEETLDIFKKFRDQEQNNNNIDLSEVVEKFVGMQSLDDIKEYFRFNQKWTAPGMKKFYEGIKSEAIENSEVIYNSSRYTVVHSKSMKAAQWWEQSCVSYDPKTKTLSAGLCTARHKGNLFHQYARSDSYVLDIITKDQEKKIATPFTTFKDKNLDWNLMTITVEKENQSIVLSKQNNSSVNRNNKKVYPCDLQFALSRYGKEEYDKIKEDIKSYFNDEFFEGSIELVDFGECTEPKKGQLYFLTAKKNVNTVEDFESLLDKDLDFYLENNLYNLYSQIKQKDSHTKEFKDKLKEINHQKNKDMLNKKKEWSLKYNSGINFKDISLDDFVFFDNLLYLDKDQIKEEKKGHIKELFLKNKEGFYSKFLSIEAIYDYLKTKSKLFFIKENEIESEVKEGFLEHMKSRTYRIAYKSTRIEFPEKDIPELFNIFNGVSFEGQNSEEIITKYYLYQDPSSYFRNIDLFNKKYIVKIEEAREALYFYDPSLLEDEELINQINQIPGLNDLILEPENDKDSYKIKSLLSYIKTAPVGPPGGTLMFTESLKDFGINLESISNNHIYHAMIEYSIPLHISIQNNSFIPNIFKDQSNEGILNFIRKYLEVSVSFETTIKESLDEKILEYLKENNFVLKVDSSGSEKEFKLITKQELEGLKNTIKQEEKVDQYLNIYIYPFNDNISFINTPRFKLTFMILNYLEIPYYETRPRRN